MLVVLAFGITMSLTAFFDVLLFRGFVASKLNSSSLSTKWTNFSSKLIDSLSIGPISLLNKSDSARSLSLIDFLGLINDRMSTF